MSSKILFFDEKYQNFKPKLQIFNEFFIYPKGFSYIFSAASRPKRVKGRDNIKNFWAGLRSAKIYTWLIEKFFPKCPFFYFFTSRQKILLLLLFLAIFWICMQKISASYHLVGKILRGREILYSAYKCLSSAHLVPI